MSRKGGSLSVNSNINQHSSYYYYGLLFLAIILLLFLFKFVGETLYYIGPRAKPTPTPNPSITPTPSGKPTPSGTPSPSLSPSITFNVAVIVALPPPATVTVVPEIEMTAKLLEL